MAASTRSAKATMNAEAPYLPPCETAGPSSPSSEKKLTSEVSGSRKRKQDIMEMLECPVCLDTPRGGPIFNCQNGHVVCGSCLPKTEKCPVCRNTQVNCRNLVAERLLEEALSDRVVACRLAQFGCTFEALLPRLVQHEDICVYRTVPCPARHRGACTWTGPLHMLVKHVVVSRCVQIVKMTPEKSYCSVIGNFNQDDLTVFNRPSMTHWKPVLLVSSDHMRLFAYLVMYRNPQGQWVIYARSYAGREVLDKWRVKIAVRKPGEESEKPSFSYEGELVPHEATEKEVLDSGRFLLLGDAHVKRLTVDKTLFEYSAEILERTPTAIAAVSEN